MLISLIQQHFPEIEALFSEKSMDEFLSCAFENLYFYHFGLGTYIRNSLLKEGGACLNFFCNVAFMKKTKCLISSSNFFICTKKRTKENQQKSAGFQKRIRSSFSLAQSCVSFFVWGMGHSPM